MKPHRLDGARGRKFCSQCDFPGMPLRSWLPQRPRPRGRSAGRNLFPQRSDRNRDPSCRAAAVPSQPEPCGSSPATAAWSDIARWWRLAPRYQRASAGACPEPMCEPSYPPPWRCATVVKRPNCGQVLVPIATAPRSTALRFATVSACETQGKPRSYSLAVSCEKFKRSVDSFVT